METEFKKINYLTEEQYENAKANGELNEDELYLTPDASGRAITNVVDNLTSTSITDALSANQGRVLKGLIDGIDLSGYMINGGDTLNGKDLNTLTNKIYIGYGHTLTNAPYGSAGFLINIPNPNNAAYARQIFTHYSTNTIYTRSLNNGTWLDWEIVNNSRHIITAKLNSDITASSDGNVKIPLVLSNNVGDKLTISDGGVLIGAGVSKVLINAQVYYTLANTTAKNMFVYKNSSSALRSTFRASGNYDHNNIVNKILSVAEGDILYLYAHAANGESISAVQDETYMTIEVIE